MDDDEIAIVGVGCRFPGADNLDEYWRVLVNGENHVRDIPESRWKNSAFYNEDPNVPGKSYVKNAGLLENHDTFDYRLFGISEVEATRMDPQQRYVLECVHMAMEDGGFTRKQLNGTNTGVIIGCMNDDYKSIANDDLMDVGGYNATGTSVSVISARVSYVYNLHGTCLTLDTACSSALIAIHLASQAIKTGDCDMMICGGVNSILNPDLYVALCKARMMSATGQCQSFCETADGYARGEGCGIVILKSLKAARSDGNKVWGTIKTGSNQDGSIAKPITAPSGEQQMRLLQHVYKKFKFDPSDVQYIEAHGTGTPRGDPTELNALGEFFASVRGVETEPLLVGSVKSNIGHTESAAGIAGLLKILLMMHKGQYVPSLHVNHDKSNVNSKIKLAEYNLDIPTAVVGWDCKGDNKRHACLNSFGFGGSNTHAIITQGDCFESKKEDEDGEEENKPLPICISGVDQDSLKQNLLQFHDDLEKTEINYKDLAVTSLDKRDLFQYRTLVFGRDKADLQRECKGKAEKVAEVSPKKKHNKVFVYCGVGTTWTGMCQEMMQQFKVFRDKVHEIDEYLSPLTGWCIADKFTTETNYEDPFLNHIAIFCVQVAITEVWKSFGILPDKIIGQSVGEVAAAHMSGGLSLEEAVNIIYYRSLILSQQSEGSMSVVGNIDVNKIEEMFNHFDNKVTIAVYSSPKACTLSGTADDLRMLTENLKNEEGNKDLLVRELKVKCAYHSPFLEGCMDEIRSKIDEALSNIQTASSAVNQPVPMISTVTGEDAVPGELKTGDYWASNIRQPVKFMQSIQKAFEEDNHNVYLEIGPRPVLRAHIGNIFESMDQVTATPSMTAKKELQTLYGSLGSLFEMGIDIDSKGYETTGPTKLTRIPRYAFNNIGEMYMSTKARVYLAGSTTSSASHMYVQTSKSELETSFKLLIDEESTPFVFEHFLSDNLIIPGATYIEAGFHVGSGLMLMPINRLSIGVSFNKTFTPTAGRQAELEVEINPQEEQDFVKFDIKNTDALLSSGTITLRENTERSHQDIEYIKALCIHHRSKDECYSALAQFNFKYGESLSLIENAWLSESGKECLTEVRVPEFLNKELLKTHFHPAAIDSMLQMFGVIVGEVDAGRMKDTFAVPKGVDSVVMNRGLEQYMYGYGEEVKRTPNSIHYNAILMTKNGTIIAEMQNFYTRVITREMAMEEDKSTEFELKWSKQDMSDVNEIDVDRIEIFSNNPNAEWIQNLKDETEVVLKKVDDQMLSNEERHKNTCVIYHAFNENGKLTNGKVLGDTVKRFSHVQRLLMSSNQTMDDPPITIITENTKACPGRNSIDYAGSELWGMARSAMHEGFYGKVRLIDIDPNNIDISVLLSVISSRSQVNFEQAISGPRVYQSRLTSGKNYRRPSRTITVNPSDILSVHSSASTYVANPYLMVSEEPKPVPGSVPVTIESFTIHNKSLYIPVIGDSIKSDRILQNDNDDQIVVLEGKGRVRNKDSEVYFLYPVKAITSVQIPKPYIFEAKHCPFYQNGILILMNLVAHVAIAVENRKSIAVLKQTEGEDIGEKLFKTLMKKKRCNVRFYTRKDINSNGMMFEEETLVLATMSSVENWNLLIKSFPRLKKVITINNFMPESLLLWIKHNFMDVAVDIISTTDILSARKISEAIPLIRYCMQDYRSNNQPTTEGNNFMLKLPMEKSELKREIESTSMKCYVTEKSLFRSDASYVVVGGLSGLGWELLQNMVTIGAKVIVTMSRRPPTDSVSEKITRMENEHDCRIIPMQVDICDLESVEQAFNNLSDRLPSNPIRGIFHGAGVTSDSILQSLDDEKIIKVMKPKIQGAWNLHTASLELPLDYFVIHSSIASVLGNPGQCNYAAANSFLDSFALYRRSLGLPAQSINWGALEVGMAAETDDLKSKLKEKGFNLLGKDRIREFFEQAILKDTTNVVYADMEWDKLLAIPSFANQSVKFDEFQKVKVNSKTMNTGIRLDFEEFNKLNDEQKKEKVKSVLKEIIQLVLVTDPDSLTDESRLTDIGIDSMAAMSLSNAIDDAFGVREPVVTLLSEDATVEAISNNILIGLGEKTGDGKASIEYSESVSEFSHIFESKDMTFMQRDVLDKCRKQAHNPYFLFVLDIEVYGCQLPLLDWKQVFVHALKLNPEFRKRFFFAEDGEITVEMAPEDDPPLDVTMTTIEQFKKSLAYDVREEIEFDINGSLPISLQVASNKEKSMIRLIMHKVAFDLKGLTIFCKDIEATFDCFINKKELPSKRSHIDVPNVVKRSILPRMNDLKEYWEMYLDRGIRPITFAPSLRELNPDFCRKIDVNVHPATVYFIKKYIAERGISLYEFMMSLYQLYLYIGSGSKLVTVGTAADMRFHVPELNTVLTRCVNYMPIVAEIDEDQTLEDFIKENTSMLSNTTKNGAYPSHLILENIQSDEMRDNVNRHVLAMNDMTGLGGASIDSSAFNLLRILHSRPNRETFLYVQYDLKRHWIKFELGYNAEVCGNFGRYFENVLLYLINQAVDAPETAIGDLKDHLYAQKSKLNKLKTKPKKMKDMGRYREIAKQMRAQAIGGDANGFAGIGLKGLRRMVAAKMGRHPMTGTTNGNVRHMKKEVKKMNKMMKKQMKGNVQATDQGFPPINMKNVLMTGQFSKQTSKGWDHKVEARLVIDDNGRIKLEWGKDRKMRRERINKVFDLFDMNKMVMRKVNDLQSLMLESKDQKLVFKTPDRELAETWMNRIQKVLVSKDNKF